MGAGSHPASRAWLFAIPTSSHIAVVAAGSLPRGARGHVDGGRPVCSRRRVGVDLLLWYLFSPFLFPPPPLLGERLLISISPRHSSLPRHRGCHRIPTKTPFSEPQCQIHSSTFLGDFFFLWGWDILLFGFIGEGVWGQSPPRELEHRCCA